MRHEVRPEVEFYKNTIGDDIVSVGGVERMAVLSDRPYLIVVWDDDGDVVFSWDIESGEMVMYYDDEPDQIPYDQEWS
jgi:hypothetical protein